MPPFVLLLNALVHARNAEAAGAGPQPLDAVAFLGAQPPVSSAVALLHAAIRQCLLGLGAGDRWHARAKSIRLVCPSTSRARYRRIILQESAQ